MSTQHSTRHWEAVIALVLSVFFLASCEPEIPPSSDDCVPADTSVREDPDYRITVETGPSDALTLMPEWQGMTIEDFVPFFGLEIPTGVVFVGDGADQQMFVAAMGVYRVDKTKIPPSLEQISERGRFYLTADSQGNLYTDMPVTETPHDPWRNAIWKISYSESAGWTEKEFALTEGTEGMLFDIVASPPNHDPLGIEEWIYADTSCDDMQKCNAGGLKLVRIRISDGTIEDVSSGSDAITGPKTFDADGNLYVLHCRASREYAIYRMSVTDLSFKPIGSPADYDTCFELPSDMRDDRLSVLMVNPWNEHEFLLGENYRTGALDPAVFSDQVGDRLFRLDSSSLQLTTFADGFLGPGGMAYDGTGMLYVTEPSAGRLRRVDQNGNLETLVDGAWLCGTVNITSSADGGIINKSGESQMLIRAEDIGGGRVSVEPWLAGVMAFEPPWDSYVEAPMVVDPDTGCFYFEIWLSGEPVVLKVSDTGGGNVTIEEFISDFDSDYPDVVGMAFDDEGNLWVSHYGDEQTPGSSVLEKYSSDATFLASIGAFTELGQITWFDGSIYAAERGYVHPTYGRATPRIAKITQSGDDFSVVTYAYLTDPETGEAHKPFDLAFSAHEGHLVVVAEAAVYGQLGVQLEPEDNVLALIGVFNSLGELRTLEYNDIDGYFYTGTRSNIFRFMLNP